MQTCRSLVVYTLRCSISLLSGQDRCAAVFEAAFPGGASLRGGDQDGAGVGNRVRVPEEEDEESYSRKLG
eukprot:10311716-Alexandrium_andersonii.AAC.1